jgi:exodeoxyribonuclease VII large subunit
MSPETSFSPQFTPQVISVTELNQSVARLLERSIPLCWISGEISNFTRASSGHWYFTLKDAQAQVRAVMFKSRTLGTDFIPREGEKIEVRATVSLYAPRGDYQLNVEGIRRAGLGNLYEAFLQLKQKLSDAGLFDVLRKQVLPPFPKCIGIVTSPQAAALRDILITLQRRAPHVGVILYPTPVQGIGAAQKISQAIDLAVSRNECDLLIVARGGGSIEDLWAFNDEQLAYTIAKCTIPVIAGIGHETDFTIADFVADMRAPTPTAAAEMAVSARVDLLLKLEKNSAQLRRALKYRIDQENQTLDTFARRLINPLAYIRSERAKLFNLHMQLKHIVSSSHKHAYYQHAQLKQKLLTHSPDIDQKKNRLLQYSRQIQNKTLQFFHASQHNLNTLQVQLELLNPQRTLDRGYAIILDQSGTLLQRPEQFKAPANITVKLAKGKVSLDITKVVQK